MYCMYIIHYIYMTLKNCLPQSNWTIDLHANILVHLKVVLWRRVDHVESIYSGMDTL